MTTKRTKIIHLATMPKITPEIIALWRETERLRIDFEKIDAEYADARRALDASLGVKPWEPGPSEIAFDEVAPAPGSTGEARRAPARRLRKALDEAWRPRRRKTAPASHCPAGRGLDVDVRRREPRAAGHCLVCGT
jgi:hypothetical protein